VILQILHLLLTAVTKAVSTASSLNEAIPERLWCAVRNLVWLQVLNRFGLCEIEAHHFGIRTRIMSLEDIQVSKVSESNTTPLMAIVTPNVLQFATSEAIALVGGQNYVGKVVVQCPH